MHSNDGIVSLKIAQPIHACLNMCARGNWRYAETGTGTGHAAGMKVLLRADNVDTEDESGISISFHISGDGKTLFNSTIWPTRQGHLNSQHYSLDAWETNAEGFKDLVCAP